jgi:hypothetical protein
VNLGIPTSEILKFNSSLISVAHKSGKKFFVPHEDGYQISDQKSAKSAQSTILSQFGKMLLK